MWSFLKKYAYIYTVWFLVICRRIYSRYFAVLDAAKPDLVLQYIQTKSKMFSAKPISNGNVDAYFYDKETYLQQCKQNEEQMKWKRRVMMETSPINSSPVIMFYNPDKLAFVYYSDHKTFSYALLNAMAMKYTTLFHCRDLFLDETVYQSPLLDALQDILYVLKKSSKNNGGGGGGGDDISKKEALETMEKHKHLFKKAKCNKQRKVIAEEISYNKFVYMGRVVDYFHSLPTKKSENKRENIQHTLFPELNNTAADCLDDFVGGGGGAVGNDFSDGGNGDMFQDKAPLSWKDYKKRQPVKNQLVDWDAVNE